MQSTTPTPKKVWSVGTLSYTAGALAFLIVWLLWGDCAWWMRERSVLPMMQILLKKFQASDLITSLCLITTPSLIWLFVGPVVSYRSDNYRGRWGRRIPFLLGSTPLVFLAMVGLGLSPELGAFLNRSFGGTPGTLNQSVLWVIGICWMLFEIGALSANAVFSALINDVVPRALIGRFFGIFRAVSLATGIFFNSKVIGLAEQHFRIIFLVIGFFYAAGLALMCLKVKEGAYPPAPPSVPGNHLTAAMRSYFKDCFTQPYYLWGIAFFALGNLAFVPVNTFSISAAKSYGVTMERYGQYYVVMFVSSFILAYPLGWLADRFHPLRVGVAAVATSAFAGFASFLLLKNASTFGMSLLAHGVISGCFYTGTASLCQVIFPRLKFAQFTAAAAMVNSLCQVLLGPVFGWFLDLTGNQYRYAFLTGCCISLATLFSGLVLLRLPKPPAA